MADATIQTGDKLQLNFDVENRGTRHGSQTVELLLDDEVVDEAAAVLDSTETGQLALETSAFSEDDDGEVFVVETVIGTRTEATFEVEVTDLPDSVILQPESDDLNSANGDTGQFSITSDPPQYKTDSRFDSDEDANIRVWWPEGTLDNDPKQGFELSAIITTDQEEDEDAGDPVFLFGVQDYDNFYAVGLFDEELTIYKDGLTSDDRESSVSVSGDFVFDDGHEYTAEWHSEEIVAGVYEIDQTNGERVGDDPLVTTSLTDSEYSGGGAGVGRGSSTGRAYVEHYVNRQPLD